MVAPKDSDTVNSFKDYVEQDWFSSVHSPITETAIACIRQKNVPIRSRIRGEEVSTERFLNNINACRNETVDIYYLTKLLKSRTRLDLEQAAAVAISAFVNAGRLNDAELLLKELTGVLAISGMSISREQLLTQRQNHTNQMMEALAQCSDKVYSWCRRRTGYGVATLGPSRPQNYTQLVQLLLRFRRVRPKKRCLYIPAWLFQAAGIDPPGDHAGYLSGYQAILASRGEAFEGILGYQWPEMEPEDDSIVLPKRLFRLIQGRVYQLYPFWDPAVRLRHGVRALEDSVLYAADWVNRKLRETDDVAKVAFWFFSYQRRLQLKVVSDDRCTRFLGKDEGTTVYQNNVSMRSTFEEVLARVADLDETEKLGAGTNDTIELIDRTCVLMKAYVDIHGYGRKKNLVFSKDDTGGKGRGPIDEYNMLCDILNELKTRCKHKGIEQVPGPVYKFLAKDIMQWNNSWGEDAFANGKVHGWEDWLRDRGLEQGQDDFNFQC